jgi:hypothetical protein
MGGSFLLSPLSVSIVVVTKKKINSKKAISAIDPALTSGADLLAMVSYFLMILVTPENNIKPMATEASM